MFGPDEQSSNPFVTVHYRLMNFLMNFFLFLRKLNFEFFLKLMHLYTLVVTIHVTKDSRDISVSLLDAHFSLHQKPELKISPKFNFVKFNSRFFIDILKCIAKNQDKFDLALVKHIT